MQRAVACIRANDEVDGRLVTFLMNTETFELTNDSGENDGYAKFNPTCEEDVNYFISCHWATWSTFNWIESN